MNVDLLSKYLGILGVARRPPTLDLLTEIVSAQLERVPFENVSKLYWRKKLGLTTLPDLHLFLDGVSGLGFGGTCYATNYYLYLLLGGLGFEATLCGADMANPDVHVVIRVRLDGREFLVDAGYAAPFREPIPADLPSDHVVCWGGDRFVLGPKDESGRSRMAMYRDGKPKHGYVVNPAPRRIEDFAGAIADSFRPEAVFRNSLLVARFSRDRSVAIRNFSLVVADAVGSESRQMRDRSELVRHVESFFGIPADVVDVALDDLPALVDPWT